MRSANTQFTPPALPARHETTLVYTESLVRQAVSLFWLRSVGVRTMVALIGLGLWVAVQWMYGAWSSIATGALAALSLCAMVCAALYGVHYHRSMAKLRAMREPMATFQADAAGLTLTSSEGSSTLPWRRVKELWRGKSAWLLVFSSSEFATLPTACLPPDLQAFMQERIQTAGGQLR